MGHYASAKLVIGFLLSVEDFRAAFAVAKPPGVPSRTRPCWYETEDGVEWSLMFEGKFRELDGLIDDLSRRVGCDIGIHGNLVSGEELSVSITPKGAAEQAYGFYEAYGFAAECERIGRAFKELGLDLGDPKIQAVSSYG